VLGVGLCSEPCYREPRAPRPIQGVRGPRPREGPGGGARGAAVCKERRALGRITGRVDVEDVLDVIFRDFCIGK